MEPTKRRNPEIKNLKPANSNISKVFSEELKPKEWNSNLTTA